MHPRMTGMHNERVYDTKHLLGSPGSVVCSIWCSLSSKAPGCGGSSIQFLTVAPARSFNGAPHARNASVEASGIYRHLLAI